MNPLLASGLVLATAGVVWLQQQNRLHRLQSTSAALSAEVSLARTELDRLSARQQELETNLPRLRATLQEHQTRLTAPAPPLPEPDRSRSAELEGRFPTNQPYFYLPKKLLANFDLEPFEDGQLTYHDTYFGSHEFIGEEVIYHTGRPIWGANYYGTLSDENMSESTLAKFLRKALMQK